MYPAPFAYHRPATVAQAIALMDTHGPDAMLLAGGHSLIPAMKLRMAQPEHLVDLGGIAELRGIERAEDALVIGAMSTHWQVESAPAVAEAVPLLSALAGGIADPQVRNRGTIGGSLSYADPAADYPAAMLVLEATFVVAGAAGERIVPVADWFVGLMETALEEGEILKAVRIPLAAPTEHWAYVKAPHPASRFALVGVAAMIDVDGAGAVRSGRIGITGIADTAFRAEAIEEALGGGASDHASIGEALAADMDRMEVEAAPGLDVVARKRLCTAHVVRAIDKAIEGQGKA